MKFTLRPGLLVQVKTKIVGNVKYYKEDKLVTPERHEWDSVKTTKNPAEQIAATQTRGRARSIIRSVCVQSPGFGFLCLLERQDELDSAIAEAEKVVAEFNANAKDTRLEFYTLSGEIVANDVRALKSINSEVRDLLDKVRTGISEKDVKVAREAANSAVKVSKLLADEAQALVDEAVEAARRAASAIAKADKQGTPELTETATTAAATALNVLNQKRRAFLDFDVEVQEVVTKTAKHKLDLEEEAASGL